MSTFSAVLELAARIRSWMRAAVHRRSLEREMELELADHLERQKHSIDDPADDAACLSFTFSHDACPFMGKITIRTRNDLVTRFRG